MKKIIVPVDFSSKASYALDFAIDFNKKIHGRVILLHVLEMPVNTFSVIGSTRTDDPNAFYKGEYMKAVYTKLEEWGQRVGEAGQDVGIRIRTGSPFQHISKEIGNEKAHWVIVGSKGAHGLKEVFLGSNAERIIRHSECPVITVKAPSKLADMKNFVFASDLSGEQDWVAHKVKEVKELLGLNMHIVTVKTPHNFLMEKEAQKRLNAFVKRNHLDEYTINSVEADYSDLGVLAFAKDVDAGMIVMGTHGREGLAHFFGGSRAEDLANHSSIPVMTFKMPFQ